MDIFKEKLLNGKVAFITGGGSGINFAIAERYAEHGAKLAILGRSQEKLDRATALLKERGGEVLNFSCDVRNAQGVEEAVKKCREALGPIDLLVLGAAGNFPAPATGMSANGFKAVVDIDLLGSFNACRAAYDSLRKPGAAVLAISATQAWIPTPWQSHVCAAKAGVNMLVQVLAAEWGEAGVRVNAIAPGPIEDTEGMRRLTPTEEMKEKVLKAIPLKRYGKKSEIADLALFLSSEAASYITGGIFVCDGGSALLGSGAFLSALTS